MSATRDIAPGTRLYPLAEDGETIASISRYMVDVDGSEDVMVVGRWPVGDLVRHCGEEYLVYDPKYEGMAQGAEAALAQDHDDGCTCTSCVAPWDVPEA